MAAHGPERLSLRALNRTTLARQMLLGRRPLPVATALRELVGRQARAPNAPHVGLWSRGRIGRRSARVRGAA